MLRHNEPLAKSRAATVLSTSSLVLIPAPWGLLLKTICIPNLELSGIRHRRYYRKNTQLIKLNSLVRSVNSVKQIEWILPIVGIVNTDVPSSAAVLFLLGEIDGQIQFMISRHTRAISAIVNLCTGKRRKNRLSFLGIVFVVEIIESTILLLRQSNRTAGAVNPCS